MDIIWPLSSTYSIERHPGHILVKIPRKRPTVHQDKILIYYWLEDGTITTSVGSRSFIIKGDHFIAEKWIIDGPHRSFMNREQFLRFLLNKMRDVGQTADQTGMDITNVINALPQPVAEEILYYTVMSFKGII
jgi:hypothetical protein